MWLAGTPINNYQTLIRHDIQRLGLELDKKKLISVPSDHPDIIICPLPLFNHLNIRKQGYDNSFDFSSGDLSNGMKLSWIGNKSTTTVEKINDDVSIIHKVGDCPSSGLLTTGPTGRKTYHDLSYSYVLTNVIYPFGRCCRVLLPAGVEHSIIRDHSQITFFLNLLS